MKKYILNFKNVKWISLIGLTALLSSCDDEATNFTNFAPPVVAQAENASFFLTTPSGGNLISKQDTGIIPLTENSNLTISVDESKEAERQIMDGFGFTLTGGSAQLINNMSAAARSSLLNELFGDGEESIHTSYLRVSIGASDLDEAVFSYNDLSAGQTDENLNNFSIAPDMANVVPVLKEILEINPDLELLATPWSAPAWMKTNESTVGGELRTEFHATYANYFVRYIQAMEAQGIEIDAMSVQNEPENPFNNPSMIMLPSQQADFIGNHLGPAFREAGITTKIFAFDHNPDNPDYPIEVLNNDNANQYIDGSAFHLYEGQISNLSVVKNAHPDKNIYFTEQWVEAPGDLGSDLKWHTRELMIGAVRNWSKNVLQWNLAADPNNRPFTPGGCTACLGAITIDGNSVQRNSAYYIIAQVSKFVPPGSVRIESSFETNIPNVAFKTPEGEIVVLVLNNTGETVSFNINVQREPITTTLPAGATGTYVWDALQANN